MEIMIKHISVKFNTLRSLLDKLQKIIEKDIDLLIEDLNKIELQFVLTTSPIQLQLLTDESNRNEISAEFNSIISNENFLVNINDIFFKGINLLYKNGIYVRIPEQIKKQNIKEKKKNTSISSETYLEIQNVIDIYPINIDYIVHNQHVNYRNCELCDNVMEIDPIKSELICHECSMIKPLIGVSFEHIQIYTHESQKNKSGTFNPNRHFYFWWSHILAKEDDTEINHEIENGLLIKLNDIIKRDKKVLRMLTIIDIRNMLKEIKKSELNKNIPLILKKLTGISPPNISEEWEIKIGNIFNKVIEICEYIKRDGRINRNYYPYYIYKIVDSIVPEDDFETRRILYYIYIQSKETVESDDLNWELICNHIPELTYRPTDRMVYLKYRPN
jgi:hypothetical protein